MPFMLNSSPTSDRLKQQALYWLRPLVGRPGQEGRWVYITPRHHVLEHHEIMALPNAAAVDAVLQLRLGSAYQGAQVLSGESGKLSVVFWSLKPEKSLPSAVWTFAEPALLAFLPKQKAIWCIQTSSDQEWWVMRGPRQFRSALPGPIVRDEKTFRIAVAATEDWPTHTMTAAMHEKHILHGLLVCGWRHWRISWRGSARLLSIWRANRKALVMALAIVLSTAVFQTAALLLGEQRFEQLTAQLQDQTQTLQQISLDNRVNAERLAQAAQVLGQRRLGSAIWPAVMALQAADAQLNRIELKGQTVSVSARASSANDILRILSQRDDLINPRFEAPVRRSRGADDFQLSFELSPPALTYE